MAAKALLLAIDATAILSGGQLIIHFGPGRNPFFGELQERHEERQSNFVVDKVA